MELFLTRCGQGGQRPAVEGSFHGDDLISILSNLLLRIFPRQFEGPLVGFGAAIAEENFIRKGVLAEKGSELDLWFDIIEVRNMDQLLCLLLNGFDDFWMAVS